MARYPIKQKGTRNGVLMQLIGDLIHWFGREAAERIVEEHFRRNQRDIRSSLGEHRREFAIAWEGMRKKLFDALSPQEKQAFGELRTEPQREGFLIVRAFAGVAEYKKEKDFPISRASLAGRLTLTPPGAAGVILKLRELKIIDRTQCPVTHKESARFRWLLRRCEAKAQRSLGAEAFEDQYQEIAHTFLPANN